MKSFTVIFFFFNDTATTEIYTLSLHDALPIYKDVYEHTLTVVTNAMRLEGDTAPDFTLRMAALMHDIGKPATKAVGRSEEHTSELQSRQYLVCRLLLEKKKKINHFNPFSYHR